MLHVAAVWFLGVCAAAGCAPASRSSPLAAPVESRPVVATSGRLFEFHSGIWLNLHHFLYTIARARSGRPADSASLADTVGLGARSADERRAWDAALAYYAAELAERDALLDTVMVRTKDRLAASETMRSLRDVGLDPRLAAALEGAAPVYRAVWWSRHDAANRAWIASMLPLLARYGDALAAGLTRAYERPWPAPRLRVDVVAYANWAGAYATNLESPHVTMSSTDGGYKGTRGLEMLFHEASHAMTGSMVAALREFAAETGKAAPFGVLHPVIFFTAGELTRRAADGYVPFAESAGFWRSGHRMARYLPVIQRHWIPHLDGRSSLRDAMRAIIADL
jgi:hypothetical protein